MVQRPRLGATGAAACLRARFLIQRRAMQRSIGREPTISSAADERGLTTEGPGRPSPVKDRDSTLAKVQRGTRERRLIARIEARSAAVACARHADAAGR